MKSYLECYTIRNAISISASCPDGVISTHPATNQCRMLLKETVYKTKSEVRVIWKRRHADSQQSVQILQCQ